MKILLPTFKWSVLFVSVFLFACGAKTEEKKAEATAIENSFDDPTLPFDKRLRKFVEGKLEIPSNEDYRLKIYEEHLNDDGKLDMIITVNRYSHALEKAAKTNVSNKAALIGYFGEYNYFVYYSSKTNAFVGPILSTSTPQRELAISFQNISSTSHKDVLVDYAIRNSQFRRVYLMIDDLPNYAFQWKLYDGWGTDELEAYCFDYGPGYQSAVKDIIINKAVMENIKPTDNYDTIIPKSECTSQLVKRFFYNEKDRKYYTPN